MDELMMKLLSRKLNLYVRAVSS